MKVDKSFDVDDFHQWLLGQPKETRYQMESPSYCVLGQYFQSKLRGSNGDWFVSTPPYGEDYGIVSGKDKNGTYYSDKYLLPAWTKGYVRRLLFKIFGVTPRTALKELYHICPELRPKRKLWFRRA